MRLAILFSGQGGQQPEHLSRLKSEAEPELAAALATAIPELWLQDAADPAMLSRNQLAQPMIFGYQMMLWRQLEALLPRPICVAGYSLGEMAACAAAGAFSATEGVALCARRAHLMDAAFPEPAGMLAIIGLNDLRIADIATRHELLLAIRNGANHFVLGGPQSTLAAAEEYALALGASRTVRLAISTPSHTNLLQAASGEFQVALSPWSRPGRLICPVLSAIDGHANRNRPEALDALARQISTPLDWAACIETLLEMQPGHVLEIGPSNALARMVEEQAPELPVRSVGDFRSIQGIQNWLDQIN
jgi:[acyl-carrier-protein] S-malonyltransferase